MPTYYTGEEGALTITGSGAPASADAHAWSARFDRPLARTTPFAQTFHSYSPGLTDGVFECRVNMDKAGTSPPVPSGTAYAFVGTGGSGGDTNTYSFSGIIESAETAFSTDASGRRALMIYRGRINSAVTVG